MHALQIGWKAGSIWPCLLTRYSRSAAICGSSLQLVDDWWIRLPRGLCQSDEHPQNCGKSNVDMQIPDPEDLRRAARKVVEQAQDKDRSVVLTPRKVRAKLENQFSLEEGALGTNQYKKLITEAAIDAVAQSSTEAGREVPEDEDEDEAFNENALKPSKKRKASPRQDKLRSGKQTTIVKGAESKDRGKKKYKSSSVVNSSGDEDESGVANTSSTKVTPASKKQSSKPPSKAPESSRKASETKPKSKKGEKKAYKSASVVESSGDEVEADAPKPASSPKRTSNAPSKPSKKTSRGVPEKRIEEETEQSEIELMQPTPGPSTSKPRSEGTSTKNAIVEKEEKSESERSLIFDEPPKKRKKSGKGADKTQKEPKGKKPKKGAAALSKDEEAVVKLKAMVTACGVRKVWKKEFQDLDKASQQVKRLREILAELGMTGRLSLEKAKSIKAKRELAQELADVKQFEESTRNRDKKQKIESDPSDESGDESASEAEEPPAKKRKTARASIMAFLGDQSD
ncbi:hypothetical protein BV22DRAFT_644608 [Leucogyrophana mollusca]|uniref:Uncharacterized protein n=1 Tax=Leucogyrophana mollusca TaxID=85980 RepID=A0ACB8BCV0_9AGAM|nr:hypothetical protein BV22DRAFT_644608 [Leucogyrophana mollusca]